MAFFPCGKLLRKQKHVTAMEYLAPNMGLNLNGGTMCNCLSFWKDQQVVDDAQGPFSSDVLTNEYLTRESSPSSFVDLASGALKGTNHVRTQTYRCYRLRNFWSPCSDCHTFKPHWHREELLDNPSQKCSSLCTSLCDLQRQIRLGWNWTPSSRYGEGRSSVSGM